MKKKTQRELFVVLLNTYELSDEHISFIKERIEALDKKKANRKPTDTQTEAEEIRANILVYLGTVEKANIAMIREHFNLSSPQKASALMKQLVADGSVLREEVKKVPWFTLAA